MKKITKLLIFILLLLIGNVVYAEDSENISCDHVEKKGIMQNASNIKVTFVPTEKSSEQQVLQRYMDIKIYNVTSDVFLAIKGDSVGTQMNARTLSINDVGPEGAIVLRMPALDRIANLVLEVYSKGKTCNGDKIKTLTLKIPKYNFYSQLEVCNDVPEFYLCQEYIDFEIDPSKFYDQVADYKEKKENPELSEIIVNDNTPAQHNIYIAPKSYIKHIIFGVVVVIVVVSGYFFIKRKKHKPDIW